MSDLCPNCGVYIIRMRVMASGRGKQGGAAYQRLCVVYIQSSCAKIEDNACARYLWKSVERRHGRFHTPFLVCGDCSPSLVS